MNFRSCFARLSDCRLFVWQAIKFRVGSAVLALEIGLARRGEGEGDEE